MDGRLNIRCSDEQKADWIRKAGGARELSDWIRRTLDRESEKVNAGREISSASSAEHARSYERPATSKVTPTPARTRAHPFAGGFSKEQQAGRKKSSG